MGLDPNLLRSARQEVGGTWVTRLWGDAVLSLQAQAGLLLPWGPSWSHRQTYIADRHLHPSLPPCSLQLPSFPPRGSAAAPSAALFF